jgi:hypothetical protein
MFSLRKRPLLLLAIGVLAAVALMAIGWLFYVSVGAD